MKTEFKATAVWVRRIGDEVQVLVEIDGVWRLAITDYAENSYSHIAEGNGMDRWPEDPLTKAA